MTRFRLWILLGLLLLAHPDAARAAASDWVRHPEIAMRLVAANSGTGTQGAVGLGLEMQLAPGWKTYWRSPGDAGLPPTVDWAGSDNLANATLRFPVPERFTLFGLETYGYGGTVILPIEAALQTPGEALRVRAGVDVLVCEVVCIPYRAELALDLAAGLGVPSAQAHDLARFASSVPPVDAAGGGVNGLAIETADLRAGPPASLLVQVRAEPPLAAPDIYVEGPPGWSFAKPIVQFSEGGRLATMIVPAAAGPGAEKLGGGNVTFTLVDRGRAVERMLALGTAPPAALSGSLLAMLAVALLGGLVLNLMPCVLPVLAMKLAGLVAHAQQDRRATRLSFLATAAGIVVAFAILAASLVGLKAAGEAVGWGLQFQQPWFLAAMALVLVGFAANLWGWFDIPLPAALGRVGDPKFGGSFATGLFATLLATPCSAPFVGTAVGFALAQGPVEIFAIFIALGLGLAAPYLAVAAAPGLAQVLPRPGRWMGVLRAVLGLALVGTAAWLASVLAAQLGLAAALALALALVGLALGLFLLRARRHVRLRVWLASLCVFVAVAVPPRLATAPASALAADPAIAWVAFDRTEIDRAVAAGRVVFVDVTADWCVTCQVNKRLVVSRPPVLDRLQSGGVVAMRADWTRPDARISAYLASFGRYGIPFNAVYGPGAPGGIALPELLSADAVLAALAQAAAPVAISRAPL
ncbi:MAG: thioredoxin family protein [Telmatospirillum sp.]|nr:thioredoxin family protein [Telmatospirillum sp.]